eukprot:g9565.t1
MQSERPDGRLKLMYAPITQSLVLGLQSREEECGYKTFKVLPETRRDIFQYPVPPKSGDVIIYVGTLNSSTFMDRCRTQMAPNRTYCIWYQVEPREWPKASPTGRSGVCEVWEYTRGNDPSLGVPLVRYVPPGFMPTEATEEQNDRLVQWRARSLNPKSLQWYFIGRLGPLRQVCWDQLQELKYFKKHELKKIPQGGAKGYPKVYTVEDWRKLGRLKNAAFLNFHQACNRPQPLETKPLEAGLHISEAFAPWLRSNSQLAHCDYCCLTRSSRGNVPSAVGFKHQASCSAYPKCVALGLTSGTCCPSTGRDGKMLDCCEEGPTACSAYSACVEEGHTEGTCCTPGSKLDCCQDRSLIRKPFFRVRPGTLSQEHPTSCSAYAKCAAAGLKEGACCPSKEGTMLDCCYSAMLPKPAPIPAGAQCEIYPDCVDLQLKVWSWTAAAVGAMLIRLLLSLQDQPRSRFRSLPAVPARPKSHPACRSRLWTLRQLKAMQQLQEPVNLERFDRPLRGIDEISNIMEEHGLEMTFLNFLKCLNVSLELELPGTLRFLRRLKPDDPVTEAIMEAYEEDGTTFTFVGPLLLPSVPQTVDPVIQRVLEARAAGTRIVAVSMGTVVTGGDKVAGWDADFNGQSITGRELCRAVWAGTFDACMGKDILIVTALGLQPEPLQDIEVPSNALCVTSFAQVELLKAGVDVFVTHGGQNSFMEAISFAIPMVVCPGFGDQVVNAAKAMALGVGLKVDRPVIVSKEEAPEAAIRYREALSGALHRVLSEASFRAAAEVQANSLRSAAGVPMAVDVVVKAAQAGTEIAFPRAFSLAALREGEGASVEEVAKFGSEDGAAFRFDKSSFAKMRVIGQFNLGFIIGALQAEGSDGQQLFIVDQHASDEKFRFEALNRESRIERQPLVSSHPLQLTPAQEQLAEAHLEVFRMNGFELQKDEANFTAGHAENHKRTRIESTSDHEHPKIPCFQMPNFLLRSIRQCQTVCTSAPVARACPNSVSNTPLKSLCIALAFAPAWRTRI